MAQLNARIDSFIALLLEISGRARPSDLHDLPPAEATDILRQYAAAHAGSVAFEGDTLIHATAAASGPAAPAPEFGAPAAPGSATAAQQPVATSAVTVPSAEELPSWMFEDGSVPAAPAPAAIDPGAVPVDLGAPASPPDSAGFGAPEPPPATGLMPVGEEPVPWWWYAIAVLFAPLGGVLGFFLLRARSPKGAKRVLIVSVVLTVVSFLLGVAAVVVPLLLFSAG